MEGEVDVLLFDFVEGYLESLLDEMGFLCATEITKSGVSFIRGDSLIRSKLIERIVLTIRIELEEYTSACPPFFIAIAKTAERRSG